MASTSHNTNTTGRFCSTGIHAAAYVTFYDTHAGLLTINNSIEAHNMQADEIFINNFTATGFQADNFDATCFNMGRCGTGIKWQAATCYVFRKKYGQVVADLLYFKGNNFDNNNH